jgi:hypothetical protein
MQIQVEMNTSLLLTQAARAWARARVRVLMGAQ